MNDRELQIEINRLKHYVDICNICIAVLSAKVQAINVVSLELLKKLPSPLSQDVYKAYTNILEDRAFSEMEQLKKHLLSPNSEYFYEEQINKIKTDLSTLRKDFYPEESNHKVP